MVAVGVDGGATVSRGSGRDGATSLANNEAPRRWRRVLCFRRRQLRQVCDLFWCDRGMDLSVPCSASSSLLGCDSGGVLVRPVEGYFFPNGRRCCWLLRISLSGYWHRASTSVPPTPFLHLFWRQGGRCSIIGIRCALMESWGTDSCGFTKFRSLSSSRWGGRSCLTGGSCCSWTEASKNKTVGTWMWL